ncbi:MAG: zinc ribbon domain-containing protein [Chloroflexi bacterium]|nr:zinc ribbon domain-containing protein [Chloroflexota bacterium]
MQTRIFHGDLKAEDLADALATRFNRGNLVAHRLAVGDRAVVQISTRQHPSSGGQTALGVTLQQNEDGVTVELGKQAWLGIAASLGSTALSALKNPFTLIGRLDDLAEDIENLQLDDQVWDAVEEIARAAGASSQLSESLRSAGCEYCGVANPIGEGRCLACGAPLGNVQPNTCPNCGFVVKPGDSKCSNCAEKL